jgi:RHS repeat-associated protein
VAHGRSAPGAQDQRHVAGGYAWWGSLITGGRDASGQMYMRNRYYDPGSGRFTQEDPIGIAGGINLYGFAGGDPVNFSDPYGLRACCLLPVVTTTIKANLAQIGSPETIGLAVNALAGAAVIDLALSTPVVAEGIDLVRSRVDDVTTPRGLRRPYIRKWVRQEVERRAPRSSDGRFIDPNTEQPIDGSYDLGHKPGHEFWKEKAKAEAEGLSQAEFNDRMNNPDLYQIEDPSSNRSRRHQSPDTNDGGTDERDL